MNILDWLDEKEAAGLDVSQIVVSDDLAYDQAPEETIFFKEINPVEASAQAIIRFQLSNALDTGILVLL